MSSSSTPSTVTCRDVVVKSSCSVCVVLSVQPVLDRVAPRWSWLTAPKWPQYSGMVAAPVMRETARPAWTAAPFQIWLPCFQSTSRKSALGSVASPGSMPSATPK